MKKLTRLNLSFLPDLHIRCQNGLVVISCQLQEGVTKRENAQVKRLLTENRTYNY